MAGEPPSSSAPARNSPATQKHKVRLCGRITAKLIKLLAGNGLADRKGQVTSVKNWKNATRCTKRALSDWDRRRINGFTQEIGWTVFYRSFGPGSGNL